MLPDLLGPCRWLRHLRGQGRILEFPIARHAKRDSTDQAGGEQMHGAVDHDLWPQVTWPS